MTLAKGQCLSAEMESLEIGNSKMKPHFALCFAGRLSEELRSQKVPVHLLGNVRFSNILTVWRSQQKLKELINRKNFDVVICHACWSRAIFGGVAKALKPLVFWCHDAILGDRWLERFAKLVKPNLAIANSEYTLRFLQEFYPNVPTHILFYPVYPSPIMHKSPQGIFNLLAHSKICELPHIA